MFYEDFLILDDGTILAMRFIESIKYPSMEEGLVDVLKDDLRLEVITTSGNRYNISAKKQHTSEILDKPAEFRDSIYYRWRYIMVHM